MSNIIGINVWREIYYKYVPTYKKPIGVKFIVNIKYQRVFKNILFLYYEITFM